MAVEVGGSIPPSSTISGFWEDLEDSVHYQFTGLAVGVLLA